MELLLESNVPQEEMIAGVVLTLPHRWVRIVPFKHRFYPNVDDYSRADFIPYGSTRMVAMALERGFEGVHYDEQAFGYDRALSVRPDMLNISAGVMTIRNALTVLLDDKEGKWFMRPVSGLKPFCGTVDTSERLLMLLMGALQGGSSQIEPLTHETRVLLNRPIRIEEEYRVHIVGGRVVACDMYRVMGSGQAVRAMNVFTSTMADTMQHLADVWLPNECCVMDVARISNGELRVTEFNCINAAGFYTEDSARATLFALYNHHR